MAELTSLDLDQILSQMGQVGLRLANIGGAEGAAGNISVCVRTPLDGNTLFPQMQMMDLPVTVPELTGMMLIGMPFARDRGGSIGESRLCGR
jgi:rhamnulose-1-phosphate aldolase